ncbi:MAG: hypothetical protein MMC23_001975 [Stictis urceolatum]|nr:hypothetical protein [Stictis urceolata]
MGNSTSSLSFPPLPSIAPSTAPSATGTAPPNIFQSILDSENSLAAQPTHYNSSPICTSLSDNWNSKFNTIPITRTFTENALSQVFDAFTDTEWPWPSQEAIRIMTHDSTTKNPYACSKCKILWFNVVIKYWPTEGANTDCLANVQSGENSFGEALNYILVAEGYSNGTTGSVAGDQSTRPSFTNSTVAISRPSVTSRAISPVAAKYALTKCRSDHLSTSPYIYLEIPAVGATEYDIAGHSRAVGQKHTNVRLSLLPSEVSTVRPKNLACWGPAVLQDIPNWSTRYGTFTDLVEACSVTTVPLDFNDLPCPPESLRQWGHSSFFYDPKNSYAPLIAPPSILKQLDPAWASCTPDYGWDPFTALIPYSSLATPTPIADISSQAAAPGSTTHEVPISTTMLDLSPKPTLSSQPADPGLPSAAAIPSPEHSLVAPQQPPNVGPIATALASDTPVPQSDTPSSTKASQAPDILNSPAASSASASDLVSAIDPASALEPSPTPPTPPTPPRPSADPIPPTNPLPPAPTPTDPSQTPSVASPSAVQVDGTTPRPSSADSSPLSAAANSAVALGSNTIALSKPAAAHTPASGGSEGVSEVAGVVVAGSTLSAGEVETVSGTKVSVGRGGKVVLGSRTVEGVVDGTGTGTGTGTSVETGYKTVILGGSASVTEIIGNSAGNGGSGTMGTTTSRGSGTNPVQTAGAWRISELWFGKLFVVFISVSWIVYI